MKQRTQRTLVTSLVLAMLAAALTGCGGKDVPVPNTGSGPTASSTPISAPAPASSSSSGQPNKAIEDFEKSKK